MTKANVLVKDAPWMEHFSDDLDAIADAWKELVDPIATIQALIKEHEPGDTIEVTKELLDAIERLREAKEGCPVLPRAPGPHKSCMQASPETRSRKRRAT